MRTAIVAAPAAALLLVLGFLAPAPVRAQEEKEEAPRVAPAAREILEAAMESMGGEEALAKVEGMRSKHDGVYRFGDFESAYEATQLFVAPKDLRWEMKSPFFSGQMGIDDGTPWTFFMGPPARVRGPGAKAMRQWLLQLDMLLVRPLLAREDAKLSVGRTREGMDVVVVEAEDLGRFELGYAKEDGKTMLASLRGDWTAMDGRTGRLEMDFSGPKAFGDVTLPAKSAMRMYVGGELLEEMEETTTSIEWNPEVGEDAFAMPEPEMTFDAPEVKEVPAATGVVVVHRGSYDSLGETIAGTMGKLVEMHLMPAGAAVALFVDDPTTVETPEEVRTEVFIPLAPGGTPELPEGWEMRTMPATKAAAMWRKGEYGTVETNAIPMLAAWIGQQGLAMTGPPRVAYHHDPRSTVAEDQISEILIPVKEE